MVVCPLYNLWQEQRRAVSPGAVYICLQGRRPPLLSPGRDLISLLPAPPDPFISGTAQPLPGAAGVYATKVNASSTIPILSLVPCSASFLALPGRPRMF